MKHRSYTQIPNTLLRRPDLAPTQKILYALLLSRCWGKEWCLASQARLAEETALSERSVRDHLGSLEEKGLIRAERRGNARVNRYWVLATDRQDLPVMTGKICRSMEED